MQEPEVDALANLEERIRRAVELVATLRSERDAALAQLEEAKRSSGTASDELTKLRAELDSLQGERAQVRTRIEKLLGQLDQLS